MRQCISFREYFRRGNALREANRQPSMAPFDPSFDPFADLGEKYADHAAAFIGANSPEDVDHIKMRIDDERRRTELLDQGGVYGFLAQLGAGLADPINLIPIGGQGVALYRSGRALSRIAGAGRGAARIGAGAAAGALRKRPAFKRHS